MTLLRHYLLAVQFFTRIPITGRLAQWVGYSPEMLRQSAAHFPGVGLLVGSVVSLTTVLLYTVLPQSSPFSVGVAVVLGVALGVWLTGAFHEDGLADVADGLGGAPVGIDYRTRALEIMKDSRVGAFGVLAVVLALLAKVALLSLIGSLSLQALALGICLAHVVSRFFPLLLIRWLPHVGDSTTSKSKPLADQISRMSLGGAFLWTILPVSGVLIAYSAIYLIAACALCAIAFLAMWRLFKVRLQGFTGDCLGATQQVCELAFYLGMCIGLA